MTLAEYRRKRGEPILPEEEHAEHTEHHPGAIEYIQIGLILAIITAIEIGIYYVGLNHNTLVAALIALSVIKFSMVVMWFMHLKFDSRVFTIAFVTGLSGALAVFTVVIAALHGKLV
jgi:cytochrome c oxidase subunit 4